MQDDKKIKPIDVSYYNTEKTELIQYYIVTNSKINQSAKCYDFAFLSSLVS